MYFLPIQRRKNIKLYQIYFLIFDGRSFKLAFAVVLLGLIIQCSKFILINLFLHNTISEIVLNKLRTTKKSGNLAIEFDPKKLEIPPNKVNIRREKNCFPAEIDRPSLV